MTVQRRRPEIGVYQTNQTVQMAGQHICDACAYPGAPATMRNAGKNHDLRSRVAREKDLSNQPDGLFTSLFVEIERVSACAGGKARREFIEEFFVVILLQPDSEITNRRGIR